MVVPALVLIGHVQTAKALVDFFTGGGLDKALSKLMGDVHADAAKLALEMVSLTKSGDNVRSRIHAVINHLESAHVAYSRLHSAPGYIRARWDRASVKSAAVSDQWACCVMAMCYCQLGEREAARKCMALAAAAKQNWTDEASANTQATELEDFGRIGNTIVYALAVPVGAGILVTDLGLYLASLANPETWRAANKDFLTVAEFMELEAGISRLLAGQGERF